MKHANDTDKRRKNAPMQKLKKRTLFASQKKKASESLRYPESKESISEDNMTQEEMKQSMVKDCIEIVDDKNVLDLEMRLGYFELRLYQLDILEIDKLFESC